MEALATPIAYFDELAGMYQRKRDFLEDALTDAKVKEVDEFRTILFLNEGNMTFDKLPLPEEIQVAPVFDIVPLPDKASEETYFIIAGNLFEVIPRIGRQDASLGHLVRYEPDGQWKVTEPMRSGLFLNGAVRRLELITLADGKTILVVAENNGPLRTYEAPMVMKTSPRK